MSILDKLGITKGPLDFDGTWIQNDKGEEVVLVDYWHGTENDINCLCAAPEMLEALIDEWKFIESYLASNASRNDGFWYNEFLNRQSKIANVIEKATGKSWQEIKELLDE